MGFEFTNPYGLAALALVAAVGLFCLLRPGGRTVRVPSLLLWREVLAGEPIESARRARRPPWRWVLWFLAATLACLGLSQPELTTRRRAHWRLLIDTGPAMWAQDAHGALGWDRLRTALEGLSERLSAGDTVEVLPAQAVRRTGVEATGALSAREFRGLLRDWETGTPGPFRPTWESFEVVLSRIVTSVGTPTAVFAASVPPGGPLPPDVPVFRIGAAVENVGIAALAVRELEGGRAEVFVALQNQSPRAQSRRATLLDSAGGRQEKSVQLGGFDRQGLIFELGPEPGEPRTVAQVEWLRASIEPSDVFKLDDVAWAGRGPERTIRALWRGWESPGLRRALSILPGVQLADVPEEAEQLPQADLLVCVGAPAPSAWEGPVLEAARGSRRTAPPSDEQPVILRPDHPVVHDLDLEELKVREATAPAAGPRWADLVVLGDLPLVQAREAPMRTVRINLTLDGRADNLPLLPAIVVLTVNSVEWLAGDLPDAGLRAMSCADPDAPALAEDTDRLQAPAILSSWQAEAAEPTGPGLYRVRLGRQEGHLGLSFFASSAQRWPAKAARSRSFSALRPQVALQEIALGGWLALAALALVGASWWAPPSMTPRMRRPQ